MALGRNGFKEILSYIPFVLLSSQILTTFGGKKGRARKKRVIKIQLQELRSYKPSESIHSIAKTMPSQAYILQAPTYPSHKDRNLSMILHVLPWFDSTR